MDRRYRVALLGLGRRGTTHANAFLSLPAHYELVGICELREARLREFCEQNALNRSICYTDAAQMLAATRPDVFCFVTQPDSRRDAFVELAASYGVKAVAMEKPMATSLAEARQIVRICRAHGMKAVVSHQQKYLTSLEQMKAVVDSGRIGKVHLITASCQAWLAQLGTHFVDYMLWANNYGAVDWVAGHVHGRSLLQDHHPSPEYVCGHVGFANGVRGVVEFGALSKSHLAPEKFWVDNRLTVYGDRGYAWGETDGRWGALIEGQVIQQQGEHWDQQEAHSLQPLYLSDLAAWLDGRADDHSCSIEYAYQGYEVMEALCISAMDRTRVDLPLPDNTSDDLLARMRRELPECPKRAPRPESE